MRVSVLTREWPPAVYGGAGVHVAQLVPRLAKLVDVDVQCMMASDPGFRRDDAGAARQDAGAARKDGVIPVTAHAEDFPAGANPSLRVFGADLSMVAALPERDLVHSHTWYANLAGMLAGIYQGIPHVVTAHSLEPLRPWKREQLGGGYELSSWAERSAYESAAAIIGVSTAMRADILRVYPGLDPAKVHVVRNGIDTDEFYPDSGTDFLSRIGMDAGRPSVVFVGRITRQKGLVHLVRAAKDFAPGTQVVLLASSPDTPEIAAEFAASLEELRAAKGADVLWVQEMAPRAGLRQVLSHATVFACPSVYEPLGIVNLEAMACEAAVVASRVGGIPEVVADGSTGVLVDYDPDQGDDPSYARDFEVRFAAAVNDVVADPTRARQFGIAGRQRCISDFSWESIAAQTVEVYRATLG